MKKNLVLAILALIAGVLCVASYAQNYPLFVYVSFSILIACLIVLIILMYYDKKKICSQLEEENEMEREITENLSKEIEEKDELIADLRTRELTEEKKAKMESDVEARIQSIQDKLNEEIHTNTKMKLSLNEMEKTISQEKLIQKMLPDVLDLNPKIIDIKAVLKSIIEEFSKIAEVQGIQISLSNASEVVMMKADKRMLRVMFRNIIDNCIKYMDCSGSVVITVSDIADDIFIVVKDNGKGLNESELGKIFDLNYQGSNRTSGNGLGLTQAKAIVDYYGGTIFARSQEGKGMAIYIQMPSNCMIKEENS